MHLQSAAQCMQMLLPEKKVTESRAIKALLTKPGTQKIVLRQADEESKNLGTQTSKVYHSNSYCTVSNRILAHTVCTITYMYVS